MEVAKPSKLDGCWHLCPHIKAETSHVVNGRNYFFNQEEIVLFLLLDISFIHTINDGILKSAFKWEALFSKISFGPWLFFKKKWKKEKSRSYLKHMWNNGGGNPWFPWLHLVTIFTENYTQPIVSGCHGAGLLWFSPLFFISIVLPRLQETMMAGGEGWRQSLNETLLHQLSLESSFVTNLPPP